MTGPTEPRPSASALWLAGARPRTLGAAVAPVLVGTAAAHAEADRVLWGRAGLALVVSVALQIGVNLANDYADGIRGTDASRVGPMRLTGSGLVAPGAVRVAAVCTLLVAAAAGLALALVVEPWLLAIGAACLVAAVAYTGGPRPYGYAGLGEVMVFVFFGLVATAGSAFVQIERVPSTAWWGAVTVGLLACALLLTNNLRDLDNDAAVGKRTLAVRLGASRTRHVYLACVCGSVVGVVGIAVHRPEALVALAAAPLAWAPVRTMASASEPAALLRALAGTARLQLVVSALLAVGLWLG